MIDDASPTLRRRELGAELRRLRKVRDWTTKDVAEKLGCSISKISRIETGDRGVSGPDLSALLALFELDAEQADHLTQIARTGKRRNENRSALTLRTDFISIEDQSFLDLERDAVRIREYNSMVVPGLLQTEAYMRATMRGATPDVSEESIESSMRLRLGRQQILASGAAHPDYEVILDEAALWRRVGGGAVMDRQLHALLDAVESGTVVLRVIPFSTGSHPGLNSDFVSLQLGDPRIPDVVFVEGLAGHLRFDDPQDVNRYDRVWSKLREVAKEAYETPGILRRVLKRRLSD